MSTLRKGLSTEERREKVAQEDKLLGEFIALGKYLFEGFFKWETDPYIEVTVRWMIRYFNRSPLFFEEITEEERGLGFNISAPHKRSFKKSLCLIGNTGVGKDCLYTIWQYVLNQWNHPDKFNLLATDRVNSLYESGGQKEIDRLGYESFKIGPRGRIEDKPIHYCFTDLGAEPPVSHFGNKRLIMVPIIQSRYDHRFYDMKTFFSTNLDLKQLEDYYDIRIGGRLAEICNFIVVPGPNRRKENEGFNEWTA